MTENVPQSETRLTEKAGLSTEIHTQARRADDHAWIEVIQRMDSIYADLVRYQVELEQKNSALENAQRFIESVISSISDILIVCDINGNIQQTNSALEELIVLGIRSRPASFDVGDSKTVEKTGDLELVSGRQRNPLLLGAVAEGGVIDFDWAGTHSSAPG